MTAAVNEQSVADFGQFDSEWRLGYNSGMATETVAIERVRHTCAVCGYQWLQREAVGALYGVDPLRCASQACRTYHWREGKPVRDGRRKD